MTSVHVVAGTMSRDDFIEASETEMADEIAAAIVAPMDNLPCLLIPTQHYLNG